MTRSPSSDCTRRVPVGACAFFVPVPRRSRWELADGAWAPLKRRLGSDLFEWQGSAPPPRPWRLKIDGATHYDAYAFVPRPPADDLFLFNAGRLRQAWRSQGALPEQRDGVAGVCFRVWAPNAERVSVVGDFNGWTAACTRWRRWRVRCLGTVRSGARRRRLVPVRIARAWQRRVAPEERSLRAGLRAAAGHGLPRHGPGGTRLERRRMAAGARKARLAVGADEHLRDAPGQLDAASRSAASTAIATWRSGWFPTWSRWAIPHAQ